jgi:hypothetical protein
VGRGLGLSACGRKREKRSKQDRVHATTASHSCRMRCPSGVRVQFSNCALQAGRSRGLDRIARR